MIADIVRCSGDIVDGFLDDRDSKQFPGLPILGCVDDALKIAHDSPSTRFVIGIGKNETREKIAKNLSGLHYHTAVHLSAVIASDATIGAGSVIMANAVVNTGAAIGQHCIVNTAATVDHDCELNDFVHLSPGVHLSGSVSVGSNSWLGIGAAVTNNVNICGGCTIGAGAVVIKDIKTAGTYVGVPAKEAKMKNLCNVTKISGGEVYIPTKRYNDIIARLRSSVCSVKEAA